MPINFEIRIVGLSLCYYKEDRWNVVFPCNAEHLAKFEFNGTAVRNVRERNRCLLIDFPIGSISGPQPTPYADTSTYPTLFNMSADYAHESKPGATTASPRQSNLKLLDFASSSRDIVWLRIPNAFLRCEGLSDEDYYVQDVTKHKGLRVEVISKRATEVVIEFAATTPLKLTAVDQKHTYKTDLHPAYPSTGGGIPLPTGGAKHTLKFNNDCRPNCPEENDFEHLYDLVYDNNSEAKKRRNFAAGQIFKCPPSPSACTRPTSKSSTYGNCDPVGSEPPPGP